MSPLNAAICTITYLERKKCHGPCKKILFKKQLFDLEIKGQGPMKVIMVRDTPPYGHAPTYQISLTYLERQNSYGSDKLRWEEAEEAEEEDEEEEDEEEEAEEKIRLKQYNNMTPFVRRGDIIRSEWLETYCRSIPRLLKTFYSNNLIISLLRFH